MSRNHYNLEPRESNSIERLTTLDSVIDQTIVTTVITAYNHSIVTNYSLGASTTDGFTKYISLSDPSGIAQINMDRGSFILDFNYPSIELLWDNSTYQWLPVGDSPPIFVTRQQGTKLLGTGFSGDSQQGSVIAISADGNTVGIAANADDGLGTNVGASWIFTRSGTVWTQQGTKLIGTGFTATPQLFQGVSIAMSADGNTFCTGGVFDNQPGQANVGATWVFTRTGTVWTQQGEKLVGTGFSGDSRQGGNLSISADGNTLATSGFNDDGAGTNVGAIWIFTRSGTVWTQQGDKLVGTGFSGDSAQGRNICISADGNTLVAGGAGDDGFGANVGAMWVFTRSNGVWTQQGEKLVGTGFSGDSGQGGRIVLSGDGNMFVTGGRNDDGLGTNVGAVWTFTRTGTVWTQSGNKLTGTGFSGDSSFGAVALSASGKTLAVSAGADDGLGTNVGASWVFTRVGTTWIQQGIKLVGTGFSGDSQQHFGFGKALSAQGNTFVVGGLGDDGAGTNVGAAWVFI